MTNEKTWQEELFLLTKFHPSNVMQVITVRPKLVSKKSHVGCDDGDMMKEVMPRGRGRGRGGSYNVPDLQPGELAARIQQCLGQGHRFDWGNTRYRPSLIKQEDDSEVLHHQVTNSNNNNKPALCDATTNEVELCISGNKKDEK